MTSVYLADALPEERAALRLLLLDLDMEVIGEADDWPTILAGIESCQANMLLIDGDLLPGVPSAALAELRERCPTAIIIILINHMSQFQQARLSSAANVLISKDEMPERIADRLRLAAGSDPFVRRN
jgi:DNA-binding NarL/FixJ family response regulator